MTHSGSGMRAPVAMQQLLSSPALVCCTGTDGATPLRVYGLSRFNSAVACADQFFEQVWAATFSAFAASSRSPRGMLDSPIKKYASQRSPGLSAAARVASDERSPRYSSITG